MKVHPLVQIILGVLIPFSAGFAFYYINWFTADRFTWLTLALWDYPLLGILAGLGYLIPPILCVLVPAFTIYYLLAKPHAMLRIQQVTKPIPKRTKSNQELMAELIVLYNRGGR